MLNVETEQDDIAVADNVIFSFHTHKAFLSCSCVGTAVEQILIIDNLGFDESALEIGVDFSGEKLADKDTVVIGSKDEICKKSDGTEVEEKTEIPESCKKKGTTSVSADSGKEFSNEPATFDKKQESNTSEKKEDTKKTTPTPTNKSKEEVKNDTESQKNTSTSTKTTPTPTNRAPFFARLLCNLLL